MGLNINFLFIISIFHLKKNGSPKTPLTIKLRSGANIYLENVIINIKIIRATLQFDRMDFSTTFASITNTTLSHGASTSGQD